MGKSKDDKGRVRVRVRVLTLWAHACLLPPLLDALDASRAASTMRCPSHHTAACRRLDARRRHVLCQATTRSHLRWRRQGGRRRQHGPVSGGSPPRARLDACGGLVLGANARLSLAHRREPAHTARAARATRATRATPLARQGVGCSPYGR